LTPATSKPPEQWGASDKLAAVIQTAGLSGPDLSAYCRERGLYPKQLARWRQAAEDANGPSAPTMTNHRDLQRKPRSKPARYGALNVSCRRWKKLFRRRQYC
jgi:transposase-like protein